MDSSEINLILEVAEDAMNHAIDHLQNELIKIRTGKANSDLLNGLMVPYYGSPTPVSQVANISTADSRTIVIQPWEKNMLGAIEKAIFEAGMGITPQNDGQLIRLSIPPLTEERRREMVKKAKQYGEDSKIGVRSARRDAMEEIKKGVKNGLPEDIGKKTEEDIQNLTNRFVEKVDKMLDMKEKDIMTV
ncbi:MAG: ribosome recycling factor [Saprospiraceae bacterium]|nr:ribosome recycling factor [Saprospiraceae bacterium]